MESIKMKQKRKNELKDRNQYVVQRILKGDNQITIAKDLGISRERVRQIYKMNCVTTYQDVLKKRSNKIKLERRKKLEETIKFQCSICHRFVFWIENGKRVLTKTKCPECKNTQKSAEYEICDFCGTKYHPYRARKSQRDLNKFCGMNCYFKLLRLMKRHRINQDRRIRNTNQKLREKIRRQNVLLKRMEKIINTLDRRASRMI